VFNYSYQPAQHRYFPAGKGDRLACFSRLIDTMVNLLKGVATDNGMELMPGAKQTIIIALQA
jgi:hypothetical protein